MMQSVKNALGIAPTAASNTYGATVPLGGAQSGLGYGSQYGSGLGYGSQYGSGLGYGSQYGSGLGYGSQYGSQGLGMTSSLPAQTIVQTTSVPIEAPMSPISSQAPLTPSSFGTSSFGSSSLGSSLPIQRQFQQGSVQRRESAPVIHERIRREEVEEIQPVIHREREKTEIHKITQPIQTSSTLGIVTEEGTLPAQFVPEIRTPGMMAPPTPIGTRQEVSGQRMRVEKPALVLETEKRNIIEEVQPVVYKETVEPHIIRLTQPIYERIVEGEVYFNDTLPATRDFSSSFQQQQQGQFGSQFGSQLGSGQFGGQLGQQQQQYVQPIQLQTIVQPVPVASMSPMASPLPMMMPKENLEVAATYVSEYGGAYGKGRYGDKYSKGSAYAYGPGATGAPLAQPRAV